MKTFTLTLVTAGLLGSVAMAAPAAKFTGPIGIEFTQNADVVEVASRAERRAERQARRAARAERRAARQQRNNRRGGGTPRVANPISSFTEKLGGS